MTTSSYTAPAPCSGVALHTAWLVDCSAGWAVGEDDHLYLGEGIPGPGMPVLSTARGQGGDDFIDAGTGPAEVWGDDGDDEIVSSASGSGTYRGGNGRDKICLYGAGNVAFGEVGDDTIVSLTGTGASDTIDGGPDVDACFAQGTCEALHPPLCPI